MDFKELINSEKSFESLNCFISSAERLFKNSANWRLILSLVSFSENSSNAVSYTHLRAHET